MRKLNLFLVLGIFVCFVLHAVLGSLALYGVVYIPQKPVARACLTLVVLHAATSTVLFIKTLSARRRCGVGYFRENGMFWARRISGFAMVIPLVFHLVTFIKGGGFGAGKLAWQIVFVLTIALHVFINVLPALASLGVRNTKRALTALCVVISVLALIFSAAFCIFYLHLSAD